MTFWPTKTHLYWTGDLTMTFTQSGSGYLIAHSLDSPILSRREGIQLQSYLFEMERMIARLSEHIAELEATISTLENERNVAAVEPEERRAAAGPGDGLSLGAGASPRSSQRPPILFRFDPRATPPARPTRGETTPQTAGEYDQADS